MVGSKSVTPAVEGLGSVAANEAKDLHFAGLRWLAGGLKRGVVQRYGFVIKWPPIGMEYARRSD